MPSVQLNKMLGALRFSSKKLRVPIGFDTHDREWKKAFIDHLPPASRVAVPKLVPQWFWPALPVKPHQDMADTLGQYYKDIHDTACDAVVYGIDMWRLRAMFGTMTIAAAVVAGPPGCLRGPKIEGLIKQYPKYASMTPRQKPYLDAVAKGVSKAFGAWQKAVTVPGLLFFPSYLMQPPGTAIPTPNVPQKLIACLSPAIVGLVIPNVSKELMSLAFDPTNKLSEADSAFFEAISTVLSLGFVQWMSNQTVLSVVGSGAVASPTGGPVAGVTMPTPGHLLA